MVNEHSNPPEPQTPDSAPMDEMASSPADTSVPSPSVPDSTPDSTPDPSVDSPSAATNPGADDESAIDSAIDMIDMDTDMAQSAASITSGTGMEEQDSVVDVTSETVADTPSVTDTASATETWAGNLAAEADDEPDDEPDDEDWGDDPVSPVANVTPPPSAPASAPPTPNPSSASTGAKVKAIAAITLTTIIQGAATATASLESVQRHSSPTWETLQSVLITVGLTSIQVAKSASQWVLSKVDAPSYAAVNDGTAPFLRDRLQTTPVGAKAVNLLDRGWGVWTRGLTVLRGILPNPLKNWPNPALTVGLIVVAALLIRLTAAIAPSGTAVASINPAPTITAAPTAQPLLFGQDLENDPKDQKLATTLENRFAKALSKQDAAAQYENVLHRVVIDRDRHRLILMLEQPWYDLSQPQQQQLASLLASVAQDNEFDRLTLVNVAGERIGRSPVIGEDMILYQTTRPIIEIPVVETPIEDLPIEEVQVEENSADGVGATLDATDGPETEVLPDNGDDTASDEATADTDELDLMESDSPPVEE